MNANLPFKLDWLEINVRPNGVRVVVFVDRKETEIEPGRYGVVVFDQNNSFYQYPIFESEAKARTCFDLTLQELRAAEQQAA